MTTRFLKRMALTVAAVCLLIVAALFHQEHLYLMAATLFLIPIVANLVGRILMGGLECERTVSQSCSEGERVVVTLNLTATGSLPKFYLRLQDRLPRWLHPVGDAPPLILQLAPGASHLAQYSLEAEKRGVYTLGPTQVNTTDPLGFYTYTQPVDCVSELVVYPTVLPLRRLFLEGGGAWGRQHQNEGATRGDGLDFHGVREYRHGDELRRVHWRTTARTGKLAVMEYNQGMTSDVLLALDLSRAAYENTGDGPDSALEYAVKTAATIAAYLLREGYGVHLLSPQTISAPLALQGTEEMPRLLEALARAEADSPVSLAEVLQAGQSVAAGGKTLVFITPDHSDGLAGVLGEYRLLGARLFGFALEAETFRAGEKSERSAFQTATGSAWPAAALVQTIRRGDDLLNMIEGGNYARR